jgi:hypothetical protein
MRLGPWSRSADAIAGFFAILFALLALCDGASAQTIYDIVRICPVGGERFGSSVVGPTMNPGVRLDLRPTGPEAQMPLVECPNGFVPFKGDGDYTSAEIAILTRVVASAHYQTVRKTEPRAARIILLQRALGMGEAEFRHTFLIAAFEAEDDGHEDVRQRYLTLAAAAYEAFLTAHPAQDEEWWIAKLRTAEIARQQSRFEDAIRIADSLASLKPPGDGRYGDVAKQIAAKAKLRDAAPADFVPQG